MISNFQFLRSHDRVAFTKSKINIVAYLEHYKLQPGQSANSIHESSDPQYNCKKQQWKCLISGRGQSFTTSKANSTHESSDPQYNCKKQQWRCLISGRGQSFTAKVNAVTIVGMLDVKCVLLGEKMFERKKLN